MSGEWGVLLDGVYLSGGDGTQWQDILAAPECSEIGDPSPRGCLSVPPDGLGIPPLRTEDITYAQRDGVRHFDDWYGPRILTLEDVAVGPDSCPKCPTAREKVRDIARAWRRRCDDVELVIYTDCHGESGGGALNGPFGVVGRPRMAEVQWLQGKSKSALMQLRFDATDHRMFILDACGTPGSGVNCLVLTPDTSSLSRCYDQPGSTRCYPRCYTVESGGGGGSQIADNIGTLCASLTITFSPGLSDPFVENLTTGERLDYDGPVAHGSEPVVVDTSTGTATQGGQPRTHLLSGDVRMTLVPGENTLRLGSFNTGDDGEAEVCWRAAVEQA